VPYYLFGIEMALMVKGMVMGPMRFIWKSTCMPRFGSNGPAKVNGMVPFRSKIGIWLALRALALQLTLSSAPCIL
jgi:hypothetical protein